MGKGMGGNSHQRKVLESAVDRILDKRLQKIPTNEAQETGPKKSGSAPSRVRQKLGTFISSNPFVGGVGVIVAALLISHLGQTLAFAVGWAFVSFGFIHTGFFETRHGKYIGNTVGVIALGALLFWVVKLSPPPNASSPPPLDQYARAVGDALVQRFPWIIGNRDRGLSESTIEKAVEKALSSRKPKEEPQGRVTVFISEKMRVKAVEVKYDHSFNDPKAWDTFKNAVQDFKPAIKPIPMGQSSTIENVVVRNIGNVPLTNVEVEIIATAPIKGMGERAKTFSANSVYYDTGTIRPYSDVGFEAFYSISVQTPTPSTNVGYVIIVTADNLRHYVGVVNMNYDAS